MHVLNVRGSGADCTEIGHIEMTEAVWADTWFRGGGDWFLVFKTMSTLQCFCSHNINLIVKEYIYFYPHLNC